MIIDFDEYEASVLADILMDYSNDTPEDDSAIRKFLAARDTPQDFTESDLLLILTYMKEYFADTAEELTPSYNSSPFSSPAARGIFSERETIFRLQKRICKVLPLSQSES